MPNSSITLDAFYFIQTYLGADVYNVFRTIMQCIWSILIYNKSYFFFSDYHQLYLLLGQKDMKLLKMRVVVQERLLVCISCCILL